MNLAHIRSKAPTRIDLAGGTVDIWPIYLFLNRAITLNVGIDLFAETELDETTDGQVHLVSGDQKIELKLAWDELQSARPHPAVELHLKLLRHFAPLAQKRLSASGGKLPGLRLSTRAKSPAGAGLGGSSTLSVSMIGALASWAEGNPIDPQSIGERLVEIVRDIETTVIHVPAGLQDYYGAMFGGLQCLHWGTGTHSRERFDARTLQDLEDRLLLFYSGQSRNSGINNWALYKGFIDKQNDVRERFEKINEATWKAERALRARDWQAVGQAIAEEWSVRRTLAPGITTPEIDQAFATAARLVPGSAGKICGAGGGGCFFVYTPEALPAAEKARVAEAIAATGVRHLPFRAVPHGVEVDYRGA